MRRATTTILWLALLVGVLGLASAPTARADEPNPMQAATDFTYRCLETAETVSVLVMMDYSRSLKGPDPSGMRFKALQTSLGGWAELKRADGGPIDVEVAVAGFAHDTKQAAKVAPWRLISGDDGTEAVADTIAKARAHLKPTGTGTDFQQALDRSYSDFDLDRRVSDCRVLFWFTDGDFTTVTADGRIWDLEDHREAAVPYVHQARDAMCRPGDGVIDRLRKAGVVIFGIQLGSNATDLRPMSVGTFMGSTCGTYPIPDGWAPGGYLHAENPEGLLFPPPISRPTNCTDTGALGGQIEPGIGRVSLRVPRSQVQNPPPSSEKFTVHPAEWPPLAVTAPGEQAIEGFHVTAAHDPGQVSADVTLPNEGATGAWTVETEFANDTPTFCVSSNLDLAQAPDSARPVAGQPSTLAFIATHPDGEPGDLGVYRTVAASATVIDAQGNVIESAAEVTDGKVRVAFTPGEHVARVTVSVVATPTTASGLVLRPIHTEATIPTQSENLPSIEPYDRLLLGTITNTQTATVELTVIGASNGPSQVCLGEPEPAQGPTASEPHRLSYQTGCIELAAGERRAIPVSFTPSEPAVGAGRSSIALTLHSSTTDGQEASVQELALPVSWHQSIPVSYVRLALLTTAAVVGAVLALWAALWLATYLTTKFNTRHLRVASAAVRLTANGILHNAAEGDAQLFDSLAAVRQTNPRRVTTSPGELSLVAKTPPFPWQQPQFNATVPEGHLLAATGAHGTYDEGRSAPIAPGLGLQIIFTASLNQVRATPEGLPLEAQVYLFNTDPTLSEEKLRALLREKSIAQILIEWRKLATKSPSVSTDSSDTTQQRSRSWR